LAPERTAVRESSGAMGFLEVHREHVEREVYFHTADLTNADADVICYDTTSPQVEIDEKDLGGGLGSVLAGRRR
jgi:hypothetical protein